MAKLTLNDALNKLDEQTQTFASESKISEKARGENLEKLVKYFFQNDPSFKGKFKEVFDKDNIPSAYKERINQSHDNDLGIDLLAEDLFGKLFAIQVKRYDSSISYQDVVTFLDQYHKNDAIENGIIVSSSEKGPSTNLLAQIIEDESLTYIGPETLSDFDFTPYFSESQETNSKKTLRDYQKEAVSSVVSGFKTASRGQLIMATGTGKTLTSMKIVEQMAQKHDGEYRVLYVMPTLQLLKQTLENYWEDAPAGQENFYSLAINSDSKTTKNKKDQLLGFPATTSPESLVQHYKEVAGKKKVLVFFSTYQSLQTVHEAQELDLPSFNLVIADEAHKTVGTSDKDKEMKVFQQILPDEYIRSEKRLFQTATPKVFKENVQAKAEARDLDVFVMSNEDIYGKEFYNYSLGQAIKEGYLTDYQIIVSAIWDDDERVIKLLREMSDPQNEKDMKKYNQALERLAEKKRGAKTVKSAKALEKSIKETEKEKRTLENKIGKLESDIGKFINLSKSVDSKGQKIISSLHGEVDNKNLQVKRLLGFSDTNKHAEQQVQIFKTIQSSYTEQVHLDGSDPTILNAEVANGAMNVREKTAKLSDFSENHGPNHVNFLNNVRFLTEGIDVPNLDAVVFLQPKKSEVDIVQAVGRALRLDKDNPNKVAKIVIPALLRRNAQQQLDLGNTETNALDDAGFKTLREVIYNLRANDSRLEDEVDLAISVPTKNIEGEDIDVSLDINTNFLQNVAKSLQTTIVEEAQLADIYQFRRDIAIYARDTRQQLRKHLANLSDKQQVIYDKFYSEMNQIIDISDTGIDFVDTITQHISLDPLLLAYFEPGEINEYANNPVRLSFERFLEDINFQRVENYKMTQLVKFITRMVEGVKNPRKLQDILNSIYEVYFNADKDNKVDSSLKATVKPTPSPVVDYMVDSVNTLLKQEFNTDLKSDDVGILEPFTGTGTFLVHIMIYLRERLNATDDEILYKFENQLFGQELLLIAYYIASSNLQVELKALTQQEKPYENLVMGNTFMSLDPQKFTTMNFGYLDTNIKKLAKQHEAPIKVVMGNPPYLAQAMASYTDIQSKTHQFFKDSEVSSLVNLRTATSLSNTYVGALTYAIERLKKTSEGIISYIFPHDWLIGPTAIGIRKYLSQNFKAVYITDLKGSFRLDFGGAQGGNVFDIMQGVAIVTLVKDSSYSGKAAIHYAELADMTKQQKLDWLESHTLSTTAFSIIEPDEKYNYFANGSEFEALYDDQYSELLGEPFEKGIGMKSNRDAWVVQSSKVVLKNSIENQVRYYNANIDEDGFKDGQQETPNFKYTSSNKPVKISEYNFDEDFKIINYRPFVKKWIFAPHPDKAISNQFIYRYAGILKHWNPGELLLANSTKQIDMLVLDSISDYNFLKLGKLINISKLESNKSNQAFDLFDQNEPSSSDHLEDEGALMYALAHTPQYIDAFEKCVQDYYKFPEIENEEVKATLIKIGHRLMTLHLNYDQPNAPRFSDDNVSFSSHIDSSSNEAYNFEKIRFAKDDQSKLVFNDKITINNLPDEVFTYTLNGRPAIGHIMQQYQYDANASTAKKVQPEIPDDPNLLDVSEYWYGGRYVFEVLMRVIQLSVETVKIMEELRSLQEETDFLQLKQSK